MTRGEFRGTLKATDWAWLAGFVDGEGHIGIRRGYHKNPRAGQVSSSNRWGGKIGPPGWVYYTPRLHVGNTYLPAIERAAWMLGANVHRRKPQDHNRLMVWAVEQNGRSQLEKILPPLMLHMMVKLEAAQILYQFVGLPRGSGPEKERLFQRMATLSQARPGTTEVGGGLEGATVRTERKR